MRRPRFGAQDVAGGLIAAALAGAATGMLHGAVRDAAWFAATVLLGLALGGVYGHWERKRDDDA